MMRVGSPRVPWWAALPVGFLIGTGQHDTAERYLERVSRKADPRWWADFDRHAKPHLNEDGGCLCRCEACLSDTRPGSAFLRCTCLNCNENCPTDRLDREENS